jgi:Excalibur calcium-binding domain
MPLNMSRTYLGELAKSFIPFKNQIDKIKKDLYNANTKSDRDKDLIACKK